MKNFTKLALVSSIAFSANAMAMQAMDDAALSSTTGQDGINIGIGISKIEIEKLFIHDNDGLTDTAKGGTSTAGAIVIQGNGIAGNALENKGIIIGANYDNGGAYLLASRNLADLRIDTDAGTGANGAFINIAADVSGLDIKIGEIGVTASGTAGTTGIRRGGDDSNYNAILSGLSLKTGPMTANVQLGAAPQGAMIKLSTTMVGGLEIKDLGILDASTKTATREAGEIFIESIKVADAGKTDLTINQDVRVYGKEGTNNGYIQMVSNSGPIDNYVKGVHLGSKDAGSIGDIEVQGLQTFYSPAMGVYNQGSVITISSK
ncbi:pilus assembly protein FilA [Acinetobacter sp. ANC 4945]|uniref:Pilus assembly protein FilA n=1 Tax=Acinetobacter amyesii TaxID=2942470 RepID=A0A1T1GSP1_9GAMM|nr:DUF6160 family protein [Acinetobacter amyesii]MCL6246272.1 pilus assembly protein FilA [Acinetobacter amyesii]OOV80596.1 pilus assembly protein FilA [Acinetobacter amyesii]